MVRMTRLIVYSPDTKLLPLLNGVLRPEYVAVQVPKGAVKASAARPDTGVVILDLDSTDAQEQLAFVEEVCASDAPVIVLMDEFRRSRAMEFILRGAYDCIGKPPSLLELKIVIRRAHEHAQMKAELQAARLSMSDMHRCDQLIGSSGRIQVVYDLVRRVSGLKATVLITGESGTGKELVAKAIHNLGPNPGMPFVAVSCGAIPETMIEAELFGHEKGAFTGSVGVRAGYLEQAGEGTLLLDEIGELSLSTQVKLLRVLQEKEFCRLGSSRPIPLRARVLFATHRNLEKMVAEGAFRRDLYFRVNVMPIHVPPLRERTEDIPMLARAFLRRYAAEYGKPVTDIRPNAMELLVEHDWPGNIRELENFVQGAVIMADGDTITRSELPAHIQQLCDDDNDAFEPDSFEDLLRRFKTEIVNKAIEESNGNKTLAARRLRVSRAYLHRLIRKEPISIAHAS